MRYPMPDVPPTYVPYEERKAALDNGETIDLPTGQFLRHVMEINNISQSALENCLHLGEGGLSQSLNGSYIQGDIPTKLAHITNKDEDFWSGAKTSSAEAGSVSIDLGVDVSDVKKALRGNQGESALIGGVSLRTKPTLRAVEGQDGTAQYR